MGFLISQFRTYQPPLKKGGNYSRLWGLISVNKVASSHQIAKGEIFAPNQKNTTKICLYGLDRLQNFRNNFPTKSIFQKPLAIHGTSFDIFGVFSMFSKLSIPQNLSKPHLFVCFFRYREVFEVMILELTKVGHEETDPLSVFL